MDAAKNQWQLDQNKHDGDVVTWNDLTPYLRAESKLSTNEGKDTLDNPFDIGPIGTSPRVHPASKDALSSATGGDAFWGPYSFWTGLPRELAEG